MTGKAGFAKVAGVEPVAPIPEFPKLPGCLRKRLKEEEQREVDEYEAKVEEFFKKQAQFGL